MDFFQTGLNLARAAKHVVVGHKRERGNAMHLKMVAKTAQENPQRHRYVGLSYVRVHTNSFLASSGHSSMIDLLMTNLKAGGSIPHSAEQAM